MHYQLQKLGDIRFEGAAFRSVLLGNGHGGFPGDIFNAICWSEFVLEFLPPKWRGLAAESSPGTNHLRSTGTTRSCCPA